jgi:hypothetical protein
MSSAAAAAVVAIRGKVAGDRIVRVGALHQALGRPKRAPPRPARPVGLAGHSQQQGVRIDPANFTERLTSGHSATCRDVASCVACVRTLERVLVRLSARRLNLFLARARLGSFAPASLLPAGRVVLPPANAARHAHRRKQRPCGSDDAPPLHGLLSGGGSKGRRHWRGLDRCLPRFAHATKRDDLRRPL